MCHVLVIEDEWLLAEYISDIAGRAGGTSIDTAATEIEAVNAATAHMPDIILSDVALAEGNGPHAVQTIFQVRRGAGYLHDRHTHRLPPL